MPGPRPTLAEALARRRARIASAARSAPIDAGEIAAKLEAAGRAGAAALAAERGDDSAVHHLNEVARLSGEGMPVKTIAATLGLSVRHVVELRAQAGVGRRR